VNQFGFEFGKMKVLD